MKKRSATTQRDIHDYVVADVCRHCQPKDYAEGEGVNNFVPHGCVAAFKMARFLIGQKSKKRSLCGSPSY